MKNNIFFTKQNYILILAGLAVSILGYVLMAGGGSEDPTKFNYEIFNTTRLTVAPFLIILGYVIVLIGIMKKFQSNDILESDTETKKKK